MRGYQRGKYRSNGLLYKQTKDIDFQANSISSYINESGLNAYSTPTAPVVDNKPIKFDYYIVDNTETQKEAVLNHRLNSSESTFVTNKDIDWTTMIGSNIELLSHNDSGKIVKATKVIDPYTQKNMKRRGNKQTRYVWKIVIT